jgi:hypothetical protein
VATGITISSTSNLASHQRIVFAEARFALQYKEIMTNLVTNFTLPPGAKQLTVPKYSALTASGLTEGVDMTTPQQLASSVIDVTTSEVGIMVTVSRKLVKQQVEDIFRVVGRLLSDSLAKKEDQDGLSQIDSFSKTSPGATNALTLATLRGAVAYIATGSSTAGPGPEPIVFVLHPEQVSDIVNELVGSNATSGSNYPIPAGISDELTRNYHRGNLPVYGTPIFVDGNITVDSDDDAKGGAFSKMAMMFTRSQEWLIDTQHDASLRADEMILTTEYSWDEYEDTWGVELYSDAASTL